MQIAQGGFIQGRKVRTVMAHRSKREFRRIQDERANRVIRQLQELRRDFGSRATAKKLALVEELAAAEILSTELLAAYHDILSFIRAYPDNARILRIADVELRSFSGRIELYKVHRRDPMALKLLNSGIANTIVTHAYGYETCRLLLKWYPRVLEIDWNSIGEDEDYAIADVLQLLVAWQENDALDNDWTMDSHEWLRIARGRGTFTELATLVSLFKTSGLSHQAQEYLFEKLELPVNWDLTDSPASRSLKRVPHGRTYYQRSPLLGRTGDLRARLARPAAPLHVLPLSEGVEQVRSINEVLAVRARELHPLTYANPREVYAYEPGRGVRILVFGTRPIVRLPLESNFGAMLIRNGLPVGYGVGAVLFDRVEIAINVFPAFRSGESSFIIEEFFRLFYHHFESRVFLVRSRQMGDGDIEPLQSGAFWFYYKLGFRAIDPKVRRLAEIEHESIRKSKAYRSPLRTLRRLAKSDVFFHADPSGMDGYREFPIISLGYVVTTYLAEKFDGNRREGIDESTSRIAGALDIRLDQWSEHEITALERLAPLVVNVPNLADWARGERVALARLIRAKGAAREREFVLQSNRHRKFRAALEMMAQSYEHSMPE